MKKNVFKIVIASLIIIGGLVFYSCQKTEEKNVEKLTGDKELNAFFSSKEFLNLKENFNLNLNEFDLKNVQKEEHSDAKVNIFYLPVKQNNKLIGKLAVFSFKDGRKYKSLYEDISKLSELGGKTTIYTSQKYFVADFEVKKSESTKNLYSVQINKVVDDATLVMARQSVRADSEFTTRKDGWWKCTTECYKIAKDACGSDSSCDFLCDMFDLAAGYCTLSIGAACAIHCA